MVLQSEAAECGLACLAMVLGHHGHAIDLPELRRKHGVSMRGVTLKDLAKVATALGLLSRPLRLELEELSELKTPCILHWDLNHFVVLARVTARTVVIHDPAVGVRKLSVDEVSKHFTGVALELTPTAAIESIEPAPRVKLKTLLGSMIGLKAALGRVFTMALAIEVLMALSPFFLQWVVDDALVTADRDLLATLALGFGLLLALRVALSAMRAWTLLGVGASVKVQGRSNLFAHLLELPSSFFEARQLGDVLSRFGSQETILTAITTDAVEAVLDGLLAIFTLVLMFVFAPALALIVLGGTAVYAALRWLFYTPLRHASVEAIAWGARRDTHFLETLRGMKTIKLFNAQDDRRRGWMNLLVETFNRTLTTQKLAVMFSTASSALTGGITILVVWLGAKRVLDRTFTVGALIAFLAYKDQFLGRVTALINRALDLQMLRIHGERLADIALTKPEERELTSTPSDASEPASIAVRDLRFRYSEQDPWVLDGVNLEIQAGESVAIVGGSGCGKTTLLKMLASLLQPSEGEITIDGKRLEQVGLADYRDRLGVVMQDDQLFAGSIAENIAFFADIIDQERVEECARLAAVHDAISQMPMGYATLIGDMGAALSGGQKQRILIARALYKRPSILLLDEATSHLDVAREHAVNEAISKSHLTRIIVAHRPETIASADRVIVLANGKIASEKRKGEFDPASLPPAQPAAPAPVLELEPLHNPVEELLQQWRDRAQRTKLPEPSFLMAATTKVRAFVMPKEALKEKKRKRTKAPPKPPRAPSPPSAPLTRKRGRFARVNFDAEE
jgi:ATP-binding cassette subfamily B protein RaxB